MALDMQEMSWGREQEKADTVTQVGELRMEEGKEAGFGEKSLGRSTVPKQLPPGQRGVLKLVTHWRSPLSC